LSRLRFLLASAALLALATGLVACGGGGNSSKDPQTVIDDATLQGVQSANLDVSLGIEAKGKEGGNLKVSLSGPFEAEEGEKLPQLDMTAKVNGSFNGEDVKFDGGLVLLPNSAYVNYQGTYYEVDPTTFSFVESALKKAQQQGGGKSSDLTACQEAAGKLKVADFIDNLENEGSADVGGTSTTKVSGDLNISGAIDSVVKLVEDPACGSQLGAAGPLPSAGELNQAKNQVKSAVKASKVEVYAGDDNIVRRVSAQLKIEPPKSSGSGPKSVELNLDLSLTGVNEGQEISAPKGAKPLNDLFLKLGVNPIELLGTLSGEGGGEGLGSLLEGLGGSTGGGSAGSGSGGGNPQAYLKCLQGARTPVDLQKCAKLR